MLIAYHGCFRIWKLLISYTDAHTLKLKNVAVLHTKNSVSSSLHSYKHSGTPTTFIILTFSNKKIFAQLDAVKNMSSSVASQIQSFFRTPERKSSTRNISGQ